MSSARARVVRSSTQRPPSEAWSSQANANGSGDASATTLQRTRWNSARRAPVNGCCGPIPIAKISRCTTSVNTNMMKLTVSVDSGRRDMRLCAGRRTARAHDGCPNSAGEEYDTPSSASSSPAAAAANTVPVVMISKGTTRAHRPCPPLPPLNLKHRPSVDSDADSGIGHHRVSTSSSEGDHPLKRATTVSNMEWVPIRGPSGCLGIHRASTVRNFQPNEHWRPAKIPPPPKDYMLPPSLAVRRTADESRFARWSVTGTTSSSSCPKNGEITAAKKRWSAPAIGRLSVSSMYANVYENTLPKEAESRARPTNPAEVVVPPNPNAVNPKPLPARCPKAMCKSLASLLSVEDMPSVHARPVAVVPANDTEIQRDNYENVEDAAEPPRVQRPAEALRSEAEYARVNKPRGLVRKTVKAHPGDEQEPPLPPRNYRSGTPVRRSQSLSRRSIASRVQVLTRTAKMALRKAFSLDALGSATTFKKDSSSTSTPPANSRSFF